jgi:alcohol dehydrogenase class IV
MQLKWLTAAETHHPPPKLNKDTLMNDGRFLQPCDWTFPVPIFYGPGRIREVAKLCKARGLRNPLIVTDRASRDLGFVDQILQTLDDHELNGGVFCDVSPNPTDQDIAKGRDVFRQGDHDSVIALGGGSGMDAGKAISLVARTDHSLWAFDYDGPDIPDLRAADFPPVMCIPTTAGTGAETESTAMVTDTAALTKRCVWHPAQKPFAVVLDPSLTIGLPKNLTAWTGCDALVHAIEAYTVDALHPMCDGAALEGLSLISQHLPRVLVKPDDIAARGAMLIGSCLAGVGFLKGLGLVHSISHMIGAEYNSHHGLTNAVLLPVVLRFNQSRIAAKIAPMAQAMGLDRHDFDSFMTAINAILDLCEIPEGLSSLGVQPSAIPRLASKAFGDAATSTNPRSATVNEIAHLIEQAMENSRA